MHPTRAFAVFSCVLLGLLLAVVVVPVRADEESRYEPNVAVLCEAWRVTTPRVLAAIEVVTERRPGAAEEVRALLRDGGAERLARLLTPATEGKSVQLSDIRKTPVTQSSTSPSGTVVTGFAGFQETGTYLELVQRGDDDGTCEIELDLKVLGPGAGAGDGVPHGQTSTQVQTTLHAPYGTLRMFLSRAGDADAIVVFVRASALDGSPAAAPVLLPGGDGASFSETELERFAALRREVDQRERRRRYVDMIGRQLERLDVELASEQRAAVVEMTIAYRDTVRERMRSVERGDREAMQVAMEALRQDYADALATVLDAETAAKVLEGLGRVGGGGFGRAR